MLWKKLHPALPLEEIDPGFNTLYDESKHGAKSAAELNVDHLTPRQQRALHELIIEMWLVFDDAGVAIPAKDYTCSISTGTHPPTACRVDTYGPNETLTVLDRQEGHP